MRLNLLKDRIAPLALPFVEGFFTPRLHVIAYAPADALEMGEGFQSTSVWAFSRGIDSREGACVWLEGFSDDPCRDAFTVRLRETRELVGFCVLSRWGEAQVEVGGWFSVAFWNRGVGTELLGELVRRTTDQQGRCTLVAEVDPANGAAIHLLEKAGFCQASAGGLWVAGGGNSRAVSEKQMTDKL